MFGRGGESEGREYLSSKRTRCTVNQGRKGEGEEGGGRGRGRGRGREGGLMIERSRQKKVDWIVLLGELPLYDP